MGKSDDQAEQLACHYPGWCMAVTNHRVFVLDALQGMERIVFYVPREAMGDDNGKDEKKDEDGKDDKGDGFEVLELFDMQLGEATGGGNS